MVAIEQSFLFNDELRLFYGHSLSVLSIQKENLSQNKKISFEISFGIFSRNTFKAIDECKQIREKVVIYAGLLKVRDFRGIRGDR